MKTKDLKIGDRLVVVDWSKIIGAYCADNGINNGDECEVLGFDESGDACVKFDRNIGSWIYCNFSRMRSNRPDL